MKINGPSQVPIWEDIAYLNSLLALTQEGRQPSHYDIWNAICPHFLQGVDVVDVNTVNLFKTRLDRFWANQDVKYDFTADLETDQCMKYVIHSFVLGRVI